MYFVVCLLFVCFFVCLLSFACFVFLSLYCYFFLFPPMPRSNLPVVACTFGLMLSSGKIFKWSFRGFSVLKLSLHCLKYPATLFLNKLLLKVQCKDESWALDGGVHAYVMLWTRLLQRMLLKEKLKSDVLFCKMLSWVQWRWARTRWAAEFAILLWWLQKDPGAIVLNVGGISLRSRLHMRTLTFIQRQYDHFTKHSWRYPKILVCETSVLFFSCESPLFRQAGERKWRRFLMLFWWFFWDFIVPRSKCLALSLTQSVYVLQTKLTSLLHGFVKLLHVFLDLYLAPNHEEGWPRFWSLCDDETKHLKRLLS